MTHKFKTLAAIAMSVLISIAHCGCERRGSAMSFGEDWLLNTHCSITIYEEGKEEIIRQTFAHARELEGQLSRTIESSDIGRFNASEKGCEVGELTYRIVQNSLEYAEITGGLFDISVGVLTELWNFSADEPAVPAPAAIAEALGTAGFASIALREEAGRFFIDKSNPGTKLDLGAVAKGAIADELCYFLEDAGVEAAIVNLGGNVRLLGRKPDGKDWVVGIEDPARGGSGEALQYRDTIGTVTVEGGSVVTSGTYERCFEEDGIIYHHILDPRSGYPVESDLISVTIMGPLSENCDILSTSCLLLGLKEGRALIEQTEGYEAVFIDEDGNISTSSGAKFVVLGH